jgi:predicted ribonuclease YlaK
MQQQKLTKKQRRLLRQQGFDIPSGLQLSKIQPLTDNQIRAFNSYAKGKNLLLIGSAGTGKTFVALYLAIKDIMENNAYKELIIIRSTVQLREQGYMPGNEKQKASYFEAPYINIVNTLFERDDGYHIMKQKNMIKFMSTSFIRGLTFDNALIIVDESQSCNFHELDTIMTRVGKESKIIFCGDIKQDDLKISGRNRFDISGLKDFICIAQKIDLFDIVEFNLEDIVRSGLVKKYLIAKEKLNY